MQKTLGASLRLRVASRGRKEQFVAMHSVISNTHAAHFLFLGPFKFPPLRFSGVCSASNTLFDTVICAEFKAGEDPKCGTQEAYDTNKGSFNS